MRLRTAQHKPSRVKRAPQPAYFVALSMTCRVNTDPLPFLDFAMEIRQDSLLVCCRYQDNSKKILFQDELQHTANGKVLITDVNSKGNTH